MPAVPRMYPGWLAGCLQAHLEAWDAGSGADLLLVSDGVLSLLAYAFAQAADTADRGRRLRGADNDPASTLTLQEASVVEAEK